ncbi:acyl-CoA dehydrogenase/oxidase [Yarrowia lipolytica]|uniref:YALI0C16797p n=3 Tax=Yarrowia lipolytica TaxID=4952 RepID=Q6CBP3_YARLI|nr:YALI0C16797p [Yarrowia lipolytica CLIB122]KAB8283683.1 acyl-CoA dehydrogenase/oxidase [Yarrowia lipolytica]KAE8172222.1 acyl-CoA dehydrogenase/oxidase [Yarrowia lipolytica]KAJ8053537.1 acyl-CoA dehydrogenase/oxidase [Yarrowia lipolytica]QNP96167.1 Acyl-CoA dehydrogenase apdG [Yarrowia lipolytica]RDW23272.1 acyl-CoA dehydrogenase/oxidase [Yarrowia lipolytica]|eukprot:XP_501919.2 YALI0C16797p [Yarrowia lipolytica CLIB122]
MSEQYTPEQVAEHNSPESLWIIIDGNVFDLTEFQKEHPGGKKILKRVAGKDATKFFHKYHDAPKIMRKVGHKFKIGTLKDAEANPTRAMIAPNKTTALEPYGDLVPYADPNWYHGYHNPYYKESHAKLRDEVRQWVEEKIEPFVEEWDEEKEVPKEIFQEMGKRGYLAGSLGTPYKELAKYTNVKPASVPIEEYDMFHELIITDEIMRAGSGGLTWNLLGGYCIGLPPVIKFAKEPLKERILPGLLDGSKRICLCITEPDAGSDVANITTTAEKTPDGKFYIVNGIKKWITNGIWADYFTVAVRTGGPGSGMNGISVLLLERGMEGLETRRMNTQGMLSSGSTWVTMEDVKVPVENLLGKENKGFKVIMTNFNHERVGIIIQANRASRVCYEEACKYAHKRKTFGKPLIEHPVIRAKLANMAIRIESTHAWLENLVFQCQMFPEEEAMLRLGGAIAGCKAQATQTLELCAREASQIFGGLSYTRGGLGGKVERLYREVRAYAIPGGSEEIMLDLAMRQALKVHKAVGAKL